jgi:hypothetical protein
MPMAIVMTDPTEMRRVFLAARRQYRASLRQIVAIAARPDKYGIKLCVSTAVRVIPLLMVAAVLHEMAGLAMTTSSLFRRRAAGPPSGGA